MPFATSAAALVGKHAGPQCTAVADRLQVLFDPLIVGELGVTQR